VDGVTEQGDRTGWPRLRLRGGTDRGEQPPHQVVALVGRLGPDDAGQLGRAGAMTAGRLAATAGLSPGATTTVVDRLVRAGYAERVRDVGDRRRVTIEPTSAAGAAIEQIWAPIGAEAQRRLSDRTIEELTTIRDFLVEGCQMQTRHAQRITGKD
jgi:DNA-binding MarR family transcriptional regulator